MKKLLSLFALSTIFLSLTPGKEKTLYKSLTPNSIPKHLAYFQLFPETLEGQKALKEALNLLQGGESKGDIAPLSPINEISLASVIALITKAEGEDPILLSEEEISFVNKLASRLPNRKLTGAKAKCEEEVLALDPKEVDLARGLLLSQNQNDKEALQKVCSYEALIDLMALQILTKVSLNASSEEKIAAINHFIFEEMGFRFPPHSVYAKDIDVYTYLPSVIDSRRGVCLGVSILYLALSQRLDLPLEAVTPPGHIYVRCNTNNNLINIETTARGIHLDSEEYLGLETTSLKVRNIKEVIGMAFFNEASVHWQNEDFEKALKAYEKAIVYMPNDPLLLELMGLNYLFVGQTEKGKDFLKRVKKEYSGAEELMQESIIDDYLSENADALAIRTLFLFVDETRESLIAKREALMKTIDRCKSFKAAYFHLAVTEMQLHKPKRALEALIKYENIEKNDPNAEYLMAELYATRSNFPKAWEHVKKLEELLKDRKDTPKTLKRFKRALAEVSPL